MVGCFCFLGANNKAADTQDMKYSNVISNKYDKNARRAQRYCSVVVWYVDTPRPRAMVGSCHLDTPAPPCNGGRAHDIGASRMSESLSWTRGVRRPPLNGGAGVIAFQRSSKTKEGTDANIDSWRVVVKDALHFAHL